MHIFSERSPLSICFPGTSIHGSHPRIPFLIGDKGTYLHPALYGKRTPVHQNLTHSGRRTPTPAIAATRPWYRACWTSPSACMQYMPIHSFGWVLLYVHRNRRLIRPGRPPRPSHSSRALATYSHQNSFTHSTFDQGKPLSAEADSFSMKIFSYWWTEYKADSQYFCPYDLFYSWVQIEVVKSRKLTPEHYHSGRH